MACLKHFSLTHVVIALIFCFVLVSSFTNAGRTIDGVVPQDRVFCHMLTDVCNGSDDCTSKCEQFSFHEALCTPSPEDPLGDKHCCCY
ncbi:hypothetical protein MKX01_012884 [Papaver californicum]|nr:hypothetical protein MKX01_012884 [Papaver californicum]